MAVKISQLTPVIYLRKLAAKLKKEENKIAAKSMSAYMKEKFAYYGINSPQRKIILKEFLVAEGLPADWKEVVKLSWLNKEREMQYLGMEIAYRCRKQFTKKDIRILQSLITDKSWWDSVDFIASNLVGHYFSQFPGEIEGVTRVWASSGNMWLIRTCLIFQLKYGKKTNFELMKRLILEHKTSSEFFIRKAIGWALRQYARHSPDEVRSFVIQAGLTGLSRKEAMKHL